jgi:hypothetical protein
LDGSQSAGARRVLAEYAQERASDDEAAGYSGNACGQKPALLIRAVGMERLISLEFLDVYCGTLLSGNLTTAAVYCNTVDQKPDPLTKLSTVRLPNVARSCAGLPVLAAIQVCIELG